MFNLIGFSRLFKTNHKAQKKPRNVGGAQYAYATIADTNQRPSAWTFGHPTLEGE